MLQVPASSTGDVIVAKPSWDYLWRRYALAIVIFGYGLYSMYDGFVRYPRDNARDRANGFQIVSHPGFDVQFNQAFGVGLPPLSILLLAWVLYASRGAYRFDGTHLMVPGHDPVPVAAISKIDRSKWDRKGIAYLHYELPGGGKSGVIKLDDFVYQRIPTDEIFNRIEAALTTPAAVDQ